MKKSSSILLTLLSSLSFAGLQAQQASRPDGSGNNYQPPQGDTLRDPNNYTYDPGYNPYYDPSQSEFWLRYMLEFNYYGPYYYPYPYYSYYPYRRHYPYWERNFYYGPRGPRVAYRGGYHPGMRYAPGHYYGPRNGYANHPAGRPGHLGPSNINTRPGYSNHTMTRRGGFGGSGSHSFGSARG